MAQNVNIEFDFNLTGTSYFSQVPLINIGTSSSVGYSEDGVNFTLSTTNGDGQNYAQIAAVASPFRTTVLDVMEFLNKSGVGEVFIFDVNGPTSIGSFSNVVINVAAATGWTMNGQALVSGNNTFSGPLSSLTFSNSSAFESLRIQSINATLMCFCADTMFATPTGPRAVQNLSVGDVISTVSGTTTVKWLGEAAVDVRLNNPAKVNPICISAGALGADLPLRDLIVSQDHAIEIDGMLINAGALVNGDTIRQVAQMPMSGFSYYHIDTGSHELLLAEGVAAESFIDYASRDSFKGQGEATDSIPEMPLPRISSARMVPAAIKAKLNIGRKQVA